MQSTVVHPVARFPEEWSQALAARGERAFRAKEVFRWIHARGQTDPAQMTTLPAKLRADLGAQGLSPVCSADRVHRSADGTRKIAVKLRDGATIETVLLPAVSGRGSAANPDVENDGSEDDDDDDFEDGDVVEATANEGRVARRRVTQCISTQVGCAMGCVFCASGVAGLKRHLGPEEIVGQLLLGRSLLDEGEVLRNVVFMGMGEPLHNYDATARALRLMMHREGLSLSNRRITVSTSGLIPEIVRLGEDFGGNISLAISLHATDDATRSALMPINRRYPLAELMAALRAYPLPSRRRITIEYTLVAGKNDDLAEARRMARLLRGIPVKVNLIPMNPIEASSLAPPDMKGVLAFQDVLIAAGLSCFVRRTRGDDVAAACGQLVLLGAKPKVKGFRSEERG